jgi:uncharacterized membrane protein
MIALFIYLLAIACWLGGMVFFSLMTAPVIFRVLERAEAGRLVGGIFPRYYLLGYVAGVIALVLALYFSVAYAPRLWWLLSALALAVALGLTVYAGMVIRPRIDAMHITAEPANADAAQTAEFDRLHRLSVALNGGVMVLNLLALLSSAAALSNHG